MTRQKKVATRVVELVTAETWMVELVVRESRAQL